MLRSSYQTISKVQFTKLRDARRLIREEFDDTLLLHSGDVMLKLYAFALQSEQDELYDLFTALRADIEDSKGSVELPPHTLPKDQFAMRRLAKHLVEDEFGETLILYADDVMDRLLAYSLRSAKDELFDVYAFLESRVGDAERPDHRAVSSERYVALRAAREEIQKAFKIDITTDVVSLTDKVREFAGHGKHATLSEIVAQLDALDKEPAVNQASMLRFFTVEDFSKLREAKQIIIQEFGVAFSLASVDLLANLYEHALRYDGDDLFDIFALLNSRPIDTRGAHKVPQRPISKEQFTKLRDARWLITEEFGEEFILDTPEMMERLYAFALQSDKDELFDIFNELKSRTRFASKGRKTATITKEQFVELRRARRMIKEEFDTDLVIAAHDMMDRLYELALSSERAELFEIFVAFNDQAGSAIKKCSFKTIAKDEFDGLIEARRLVRQEFGEELTLASDDVMDRFYEYALRSESDELFDLFARLNTVPEPDEIVEEKPEPKRSLRRFISLFGPTAHDVAAPAPARAKAKTDIVVGEAEAKDEAKLVADDQPEKTRRDPERGEARSAEPRAGAEGDTDNRWCLRSIDGRLFIRLASHLRIGELDGELVANGANVDREHAVIDVTSSAPTLIARNNDVLVNNRRIGESVMLRPGDRIRILHFVLRVERLVDEAPAKVG